MPSTTLVMLHGIFRRAMKVWGLPINPAASVERPRYSVSDDLDAFSPEEVWALVRAAGSDQDAALYLTAAFTGLRMGELLALQWRDVDYSGEAIRVRRSYNVHGGVGSPKSGKVRSVPMVSDVASALARLADREFWTDPEDLVFANELGTFQDASSIRIRYRAALTRAGLRQLRSHDLRHTFGTLAVRRAEGRAVQARMGGNSIEPGREIQSLVSARVRFAVSAETRRWPRVVAFAHGRFRARTRVSHRRATRSSGRCAATLRC